MSFVFQVREVNADSIVILEMLGALWSALRPAWMGWSCSTIVIVCH